MNITFQNIKTSYVNVYDLQNYEFFTIRKIR